METDGRKIAKARLFEAKIKRCIFMTEFRGTTICAVKRDGVTAIAGDGQVTMGESVIFKNSAVKVRRIYGGKVILGFAGSVTDAFSLSERFEGMLKK